MDVNAPYDAKTVAVAQLLMAQARNKLARVLVVGCGDGIEAVTLANVLGAEVIGIDIENRFDAAAGQYVDLRVGDATRLEFADRSFDLVYSFHALEHIPDYRRALAEMHRVLIPRRLYFVGTPNRSRLIGYLGSKSATRAEKIRWNMDDWRMRMRGRFRNEYGAHAGYTRSELSGLLGSTFGTVKDLTLPYYQRIYPRHAKRISALERTGLSRLLLPAVYFCGTRT